MPNKPNSSVVITQMFKATEDFLKTDKFMTIFSSCVHDLSENENLIDILSRALGGEYISNKECEEIKNIIISDAFRNKIKEKINEISFPDLEKDEIDHLKDLLNCFSICAQLVKKITQGNTNSLL